jgi:hypothetical protein
LQNYGLDISDKRYTFKSFEQFTRNPNIVNDKSLIIVDEAHILRSQIVVHEQEDQKGVKHINVTGNKRGYAILEA